MVVSWSELIKKLNTKHTDYRKLYTYKNGLSIISEFSCVVSGDRAACKICYTHYTYEASPLYA